VVKPRIEKAEDMKGFKLLCPVCGKKVLKPA
jgi:hypothetical protein